MHFSQPKGEFTLVIEGYFASEVEAHITESVLKELRRLRREGVPAKEAINEIASATNLPRNLLYKAWLELS
jgi:16S rRNA C1402 (ribose-2'-O) methylase RsmI